MSDTNATSFSDNLLKTKLHIPQSRPELVPRPRLIELINRRENPCFTLISAPAGFGKTTFLSEWARQSQVPIAWLSLDANDNDPVRFLSYAAAALMTIDPTVGDDALAAIQAPQAQPIDVILALLINDVTDYQKAVTLIFDDYQYIESEEVHQAVFSVIERLPPNLQILLSTRVDPPWPFARLRARGTMSEIRANDLRFTHSETGQFLNEVMDLNLTAEELSKLDERTEGWIAGLQMVALSLHDRTDRTAFIESFSGSHRYILDYLMEEVLERQPPEIRTFLLETSILERLSAPLCEELTGQPNAHKMLDHIDQSNLFLIPLDEERRWYRYHHLFSELLKTRLKEIHEQRLLELHEKASQWFEKHDLINEAIHHGLEGQDEARSIQLLESKALELVFQGGLWTLDRWIKRLPRPTVAASPRLCLAEAWAYVYMGNFEACRLALDACEGALGADGANKVDQGLILGQLNGIRAYIAWFEGEIDASEQYARQSLTQLPESDKMGRAWAHEVLGAMLRSRGELEEAQVHLENAIEISIKAGALHMAIDAYWELSVLTYTRGQLDETMRLCQQAIDLANRFVRQGGQRLPVIGYIYTRYALVYFARGDLERALQHALEGLRLSKRWGVMDALVMSQLSLARVYASRKEYDRAQQAFNDAKNIASDLSPMYLATVESHETLMHLERGDLRTAFEHLKHTTSKLSDRPNHVHFHEYSILARVNIAQSSATRKKLSKQVIELLKYMEEKCDEINADGTNIEILLTLVLAHQAMGNETEAMDALEKALRLAQTDEYIQPFIRVKSQIVETMRNLLRKDRQSTFITKILQHGEPESKPAGVRAASMFLAEDLSQRELDVLRLLPSQLSTNEIAEELYVATSTVRSHIKSIYGKLAVHSRREAVARAKELDLL